MELSIYSDEHYMKQALNLAQQAFEDGEIPIGCIVVSERRIIGRGYNQVERLQDATAHAEMLAITAASEYLGSKYLDGCAVYVTIEPCTMCAGALQWVRAGRVIFGASEPKFGYSRYGEHVFHPKTEVTRGVMETECGDLMREFFRQKRK